MRAKDEEYFAQKTNRKKFLKPAQPANIFATFNKTALITSPTLSPKFKTTLNS
jgi:hypothetical protein